MPEPRTLIENFCADVEGPGAPHSTTVAEAALEKAGHFKKAERVIGTLPVGKVVKVVVVESEVDVYDPEASVIAAEATLNWFAEYVMPPGVFTLENCKTPTA